jgi:hypothetical protein
MIDVVITAASTEPDDIPRAEMDTRISSGKPIEHAVTKVYRIEIETEEDFNDWLRIGHMYSVNTEQLVAKPSSCPTV